MGEPWPNFQSIRSTVLIVDAESGEQRFLSRIGNAMRGHGSPEDIPLFYVSLYGFNLTKERGAVKLEDLINEIKPGLVIIDAMAGLMLGGDENLWPPTPSSYGGRSNYSKRRFLPSWMAYTSNESGQFEIYVRRFPDVGGGGRWQVSTNYGDSPLCSPDGRELLYCSGDSVMAVAVETEPTFKPGKPEVLLHGTYVGSSALNSHIWDISPDGKRFLMMKWAWSTTSSVGGQRINVVVNWFKELKEKVPAPQNWKLPRRHFGWHSFPTPKIHEFRKGDVISLQRLPSNFPSDIRIGHI